MIAEVLAVGSELLLGQIANTNARDIAGALATVGVETVRLSAVADEPERLVTALGEALGRAEVVVICGGLGPTHDDLTREGLAEATGRPLERRPELEAALRERFRAIGRTMAAANLKQADCPVGAESIVNPLGTAPGVFLEHEGRLVFALPGVPDEMAAMLADFVLPTLAARTGGLGLTTRTIRTAGIGESDLAERVKDVLDRVGSTPAADGAPRLAILASDGEVRLCLTARGHAQELAALDAEIRGRLGALVYGADGDSLAGAVSAVLRERGMHLAVAESLTGGMLAARIVGVPGASEVLVAGYVAYTPAAKVRDLGVPQAVIDAHGLVSEETARAMAEGALRRTRADVALSTTGEAGPLPAEADVGRVCIGLAWAGGSQAWSYSVIGGREVAGGGSVAQARGREMIRRRTCTFALARLHRWLTEQPGLPPG